MTLALLHTAWEWVAAWAYWAGMALAIAMIPVVLASKRLPQAKTAWILGIVGFPWIGTFLYLTAGRKSLHRKVVRLRGARGESFAAVDRELSRSGVLPGPHGANASAADLGGVGSSTWLGAGGTGRLPRPVPGNEVRLLMDGPEAFAAARAAIEGAKHHVHLVTYIFENDPTGKRVVEVLAAAARRGVEVRVLYDGWGSVHTSRRLFEPLSAAGGKVTSFLPFSAFVGTWFRVNLRNHRKLLVVDGKIAFAGGMNVGQEYATDSGWRDAHASFSGPVVPSLQRVFAEDWHFATGELLDAQGYYPAIAPRGDVPAQVVASGPDQEEPAAEEAMFALLTSAERSVDVMTPYLVPTEPIEEALKSAARRGRRVRVLLGETIDHRFVRWATDAYLPGLIRTGVEVWRHPAMIHGKVLIVDRKTATLGSTNLDARSLRLNFELNVTMPHVGTAEALTQWFERDLKESRRLSVDDLAAPPFTRLARAGAHLLSPLL